MINLTVILPTLSKISGLKSLIGWSRYLVLTAAEIMFSIQGLAFSYAQAPASMKSVVTSAWLITVAVGNSVTIAVASVQFFKEQANEFFFFAGLVTLFACLFGLFTRGYVYVEDRTRAR